MAFNRSSIDYQVRERILDNAVKIADARSYRRVRKDIRETTKLINLAEAVDDSLQFLLDTQIETIYGCMVKTAEITEFPVAPTLSPSPSQSVTGGNIYNTYVINNGGILGEVVDLAARNALTGGTSLLSGGALVQNAQVIATDNNVRKLYQFTGDAGDSGASFWIEISDVESPSNYFTSLADSIEMQSDLGGLAQGTTVADLKGDSITSILDRLLFPAIAPSIATQKSVNLTDNIASVFEVGTSITPTLTSTFNQGRIRNGNGVLGPVLVGLPVDHRFSGAGITGTQTLTTTDLIETYTLPSGFKLPKGTSSWSVTVNHSAGSGTYQDSHGTDSTLLDGNRVSGSVNATTSVDAFYKWFAGTGSIPTNSSQVRALSTNGFLNINDEGSFTLVIPQGQVQIAFAVPAGKTVQVLFRESSNANVTSSFTVSTFNVNDAGGDPVSYDVYTSTLATGGYTTNANYDITIS